jgi:hypothetical protein
MKAVSLTGVRQHPRHIAQPNPRLTAPMQHAHRQSRPLQKTQARTARLWRLKLIAHTRHHLVGDPLPQLTILRVMVMHRKRSVNPTELNMAGALS